MSAVARSPLPTTSAVASRPSARRGTALGEACPNRAPVNCSRALFAFRSRCDSKGNLHLGVVRAAAADDAAETSPSPTSRDSVKQRANAMRVKQLKSCLGYMGISSAAFFEKGELVDAVIKGWEEKLKRSTSVPLRQIVGMPGNPRAGYVLVTLDCGDDSGFVDFLIDTGATTALISPKLRETLGSNRCADGAAIRGLGSMGETIRQKTTISGLSLGSLELANLSAVVTDLSATGLPAVVGGMLGLSFLEKFETEFDFTNKTLSFHKPGTIGSGAVDVSTLVEVPLKTHPTGLKTVRCSLNNSKPFDAVVDAGSFFSVVSWLAADSGKGLCSITLPVYSHKFLHITTD